MSTIIWYFHGCGLWYRYVHDIACFFHFVYLITRLRPPIWGDVLATWYQNSTKADSHHILECNILNYSLFIGVIDLKGLPVIHSYDSIQALNRSLDKHDRRHDLVISVRSPNFYFPLIHSSIVQVILYCNLVEHYTSSFIFSLRRVI